MWSLAIVLGLGWPAYAEDGPGHARPEIEVFKLPTCGCCRTWIKYLEANGFRVKATDQSDLVPVRERLAIPEALTGCHTATVDGYILEGHVSAEEIDRLLAERPKLKGLFVPGMPHGAQGMEAPDVERYEVIALREDGTTEVFATHEASALAEHPEAASAASGRSTGANPSLTDALPGGNDSPPR